MASSLKGRLARLRGLGLVTASEMKAGPKPGSLDQTSEGEPTGRPADRPASARPAFLNGWERIADLVWTRVLRYGVELPDELDAAPFAIKKARSGLPLDPGASRLGTEGLRFFDLETTGLSGGAGTVAFLAAVGMRDDEGFAVRQLFLEDYPGEAAFIEALAAELGAEGAVVVTYNGKAFDLPLLRTRCVMNGLAVPALRDMDALFCARRLWRRVHGGASLGLLEREVLGVEREEDVPGSEIPGIWFEYLRRADHPLMGAVMSHNAQDVASLASLVARAARAFAEPRRLAASSSIDRAGLGRGLVALGRAQEGEELLEAAAGDGDEAAGLFLSRRYRREGRHEDRRRVLELLPETYASCVERAKFHEHAARDLESALRWARAAERSAEAEEDRAAIATRLLRLERKYARQA